MTKKLLITALVVIIVSVVVFLFAQKIVFRPTISIVPQGITREDVATLPRRDTDTDPNRPVQDITIIASDLSIPWEVVTLPSGEILVSERTGTIARIGADVTRIELDSSRDIGEGGLLGMTLHPDFADNRWLYIYETFQSPDGTKNRVMRYVYADGVLSEPTVIITDIDGAQYHDGGRIAFGPDGLLYITTGDATTPETAQDLESLSGKILRLGDDGSIPSDNPFGTAVYSYGHRNPQGLTWDDDGGLWSTEHGRSGVLSGFDEVNFIVAGGNYGWPEVQGDERRDGMIPPAAHSGPTETWAPASAHYWDGSIWFAGLRGQSLYEATIDGSTVTGVVAHLREDYGRLRTLTRGPGDTFYLTTSNTDNRAQENPGDDRLIQINPRIFRSGT